MGDQGAQMTAFATTGPQRRWARTSTEREVGAPGPGQGHGARSGPPRRAGCRGPGRSADDRAWLSRPLRLRVRGRTKAAGASSGVRRTWPQRVEPPIAEAIDRVLVPHDSIARAGGTRAAGAREARAPNRGPLLWIPSIQLGLKRIDLSPKYLFGCEERGLRKLSSFASPSHLAENKKSLSVRPSILWVQTDPVHECEGAERGSSRTSP